jgi:hypothetical protein
MKIGVIYVAPGQVDQNTILQNEAGSPEFNAFLRSLGWMVRRHHHCHPHTRLTDRATG